MIRIYKLRVKKRVLINKSILSFFVCWFISLITLKKGEETSKNIEA